MCRDKNVICGRECPGVVKLHMTIFQSTVGVRKLVLWAFRIFSKFGSFLFFKYRARIRLELCCVDEKSLGFFNIWFHLDTYITHPFQLVGEFRYIYVKFYRVQNVQWSPIS